MVIRDYKEALYVMTLLVKSQLKSPMNTAQVEELQSDPFNKVKQPLPLYTSWHSFAFTCIQLKETELI